MAGSWLPVTLLRQHRDTATLVPSASIAVADSVAIVKSYVASTLIKARLAVRPGFPAPMNPVPVIWVPPNHRFDHVGKALGILAHAFAAVAGRAQLDHRQEGYAMARRIALAHHKGGQHRHPPSPSQSAPAPGWWRPAGRKNGQRRRGEYRGRVAPRPSNRYAGAVRPAVG